MTERDFDLGDLALLLLAGFMAHVRDRLLADGDPDAAEIVADLVEIADDAVGRRCAG